MMDEFTYDAEHDFGDDEFMKSVGKMNKHFVKYLCMRRFDTC